MGMEIEASRAGRAFLADSGKLIVKMAEDNPTWGEERVAAELLLKLGIRPLLLRQFPPHPGIWPGKSSFRKLRPSNGTAR
jgi:hypothetical protein